MKEKPILFSGPMVRAILDGRKSQTRRAVNPQPRGNEHSGCGPAREYLGPKMAGKWGAYFPDFVPSPYRPGQTLWVRETWCEASPEHRDDSGVRKAFYRERTTPDGEEIRREYIRLGHDYKWKPSIFMPRWASRITLEVTGVRVERLQEISEADAIAEGSFLKRCSCSQMQAKPRTPIEACFRQTGCHIHGTEYRILWESINGPGSWDANPWVWCIEFRRIQPEQP